MMRTENVGELISLTASLGPLFSTHLCFHLGALFKFVPVWDGVKKTFRKKTSFLEKEIYF